MNSIEACILRLKKYLEDVRDNAALEGTSSGQSLDAALKEVKLLTSGGSLPSVGGHTCVERGTYQAIVEVGPVRALLTFEVRDEDFVRPRELLRIEEPRRIGDVGR